MKKIITISRQFGSGGRTIGKAIAERLGYKCYDMELVNMVAEETGFDPSFIADVGEYAPGKSILSYAFTSAFPHGAPRHMNASDYLWSTQCKLINEIADKGNCVIVGRCADYILKDREDCLNVFIYANDDFRAHRIVELYGERDVSPAKRIEDKDARRKVNYKYFTGRNWGEMSNYHICLDSSVIGHDECVEIIVDIARK